MPAGVKATCQPSHAASGAPSQPFGAKSAVSAMQDRAAGKPLPHECPGQQKPERHRDRGGEQRRDEGESERVEHARLREQVPEPERAELKRA